MRGKMKRKIIHNSSTPVPTVGDNLNNGNVKTKKAKLKRKNKEINSDVINNTPDNVETPAKKIRHKSKEIPNEEPSSVPDTTSPNGKRQIGEELMSENEGDEQALPTSNPKESKEEAQFSVSDFKSSFRSASGLNILRKFVSICTENTGRDLASEYINASGNVLEILRLLEGCDSKDLTKTSLVFSGMHIVIMKILEKFPQLIGAAQEACHHFINAHLSTVHVMMSNQSSPKQRKIVLRLLTAIVSLGGTLPRELLAHLSFHRETLTLLAQQTKPTDLQSVRTCFIHFILSFLVDARPSVVRGLLNKRGLLASILPELIYDSQSTILLVLNTIKTHVLENSSVSKTLKLQVFSTPVVQNLVSLYNWKGPNSWPGSEKKRKSVTDAGDLQEKTITVEAVHDLLVVLLTSTRHGIIFNDKTLGTTQKHNQLVNTILQSLERPWDHEKPCDLVCKILAACPDLIKPQLTYAEPFFVPRPSNKWLAVMGFVKRVLGSVAPENFLKSSLAELTPLQLASASLTLTMPSNVLKNAVVPSLTAANVVVRHEAVLTLTVMLRQVRRFLDVARHNLSVSEYSTLQSRVRDYFLKNAPSVDDLLRVWRHANELREDPEEINSQEAPLAPPQSHHFSSILDLIQQYQQIYTEYLRLDIEELKEDPRILVTSLNQLGDIEEDELHSMKLKAIEVSQALNTKSFQEEGEFVRDAFDFLISLLENPSEIFKSRAAEILKKLLGKLKIFDNCENQIDIWLNSLGLLRNASEKAEVAQWLVMIIQKTIARSTMSPEVVEDVDKVQEEKMQPTTSIPSILYTSLESLREQWNESAGKFIGFITVLTLHCQASPDALIHLSEDILSGEMKYLKSWKTGQTPIPLKKTLSKNIIGKLSKSLLADEEITLDGILTASLSAYDVLNLLRMTVFYLTQFIERKELSQEQFDRYKLVIIQLLGFYKNTGSDASDSNSLLECSRHVSTHPVLLNVFTPVSKSILAIEEIVTTGLVDIFDKIVEINDESNIPDLFLLFRNKLVADLQAILRRCAGGLTVRTTCLVRYIENLQLSLADLQGLVKKLTNLPKVSFLTEDRKSLSIWGAVAPKLLELLSDCKQSENHPESPEETQVVHKLLIHFTYLKYTGVNVDIWENSLHKFLKSSPHCLPAVDVKTFNSLLDNKISESTIRLICFLTARDPKLIPLFTKYISAEKSRIGLRELIFSVLSSNLTYKWDLELVATICKEYEQNIIDYFSFSEDNQDWINRHVDSVAYLVDSSFSPETCEKISTTILSRGDKLETVDLNYIKLLQNLFTRLAALHRSPQEILRQLLQVLIRLIVSTLKKNATDESKMEILCTYTSQTIAKLKSNDQNFVFEDLSKSSSWPQFTRFSLRSGLKKSKDDSPKKLPLLKTLSEVCDISYKDKSEVEYVKTLFEMTTSHSEFVNVMLSSQWLKKDLLQLIFVLVRKRPTIMSLSHIPLYLSAYNATLSQSDQQILLILQFYERSGIQLIEYKPYLCGEAAAAYHSVRGETDTVIWRQPSASQVLQIFNIDMVKTTIANFPVRRSLELNEFEQSDNIYDPAFYLPLLMHLLAENNVIACHNVTRSGALALVFAACGSSCQDTRMAALTVLSRFYFHLETTRSKEKLLWMRVIDALRNGMASLECPLADVRLNCFISTFLARSSLVITEPLNPLYSPLQKFFMAKAELDLRTIPEFLTLFNSSDINHKIHRHWILEVIRDGLKTPLEMQASTKCSLFRTLFYAHGSTIADPATKILILEIINSAVKIPKVGIFCRNSGLLVWLSDAAGRLDSRDIEGIQLIINIVTNLLDTLSNCNDKDSHIQFMLLDILKNLIPKSSRSAEVSSRLKLLSSTVKNIS